VRGARGTWICGAASLLACFLVGFTAFAQDSRPSALSTVAADVAKNNLIVFIQPEYQPLAKAASIVGKTRAEIVVDKAGNVASVKLLSGHPMLAPTGIAAIKKWKYKPCEIGGAPAMIRTEVEVSIPARFDEDDQTREQKFQQVFWPNQKAGEEALRTNDLKVAESKLLVARSAAEERGEQKWLEICEVITLLASVKYKQDDFDGAESLYKESLALHEKHQRSDEAEVAGAQQNLAFLYFRTGRLNDQLKPTKAA
jgi:TonB family protein